MHRRTARSAALQALVDFERGVGDRIAALLDPDRIVPRDRALASELAHGVLRNERFLDAALAGFAHKGLPTDPALRAALRLGACQLLVLGGVPPHAAVHETVGLVRHATGFVNAVLRQLAHCLGDGPPDPAQPLRELALDNGRTLRLPTPIADADELAAVRHSLPTFLLTRWRAAHGAAAADAAAKAASTVPPITLRPCRGRSADALAAELCAEQVQSEVHGPLLRWTGGASPFATAAFRQGAFVVQDATAFAAAAAVGAGPGETIVDLCAAPGTKSTLLAERVGPQGRVLAWDVDAARRPRIRENAQRLRLQSVLQVLESAQDLPHQTADAVLADVPCSNTGVLGRRVEVRSRLRPQSFGEMALLQRQLLHQALGCVRPGGRVVYSTCSIEPEENEQVVQSALGPGVRLERSATTLPAAGDHDGGYFAVLRVAAPGAAG